MSKEDPFQGRKHLLYPEALIALAPEHTLDRMVCPFCHPRGYYSCTLEGRVITIKPCIHIPALPLSGAMKIISHSIVQKFLFF